MPFGWLVQGVFSGTLMQVPSLHVSHSPQGGLHTSVVVLVLVVVVVVAVVVVGVSQMPAWLQTCPVEHIVPHEPQLVVVFRSVQVPEQQSPGLSSQALLQAPQLSKSVCKFTHVPAQLVSPVGQTHAPPTQLPPVGHFVPHAPQLFESVFVFVHVPLHTVVRPAAQQMPNSGGFETLGFTQLREQQLMGVGHVWPLGLHGLACATAAPARTARAATTSEPRTRIQNERARAGKPRTTFICGPPLVCGVLPTPTCDADSPANRGATSTPPHTFCRLA
jgi:hypothetical protein